MILLGQTMCKTSDFATLFLIFSVASVSAQVTSGWPDTTRLLTRERMRAKDCIDLLKSTGDRPSILQGRVDYDGAKNAADGVIAGFMTALIEGGKPQDLPTIQADLKEAGEGLKKVCDGAVRAALAAKGTKGPVTDAVTGAVGPVIDGLEAATGALWSHHIEMAKLEREMIQKQLEAAKWPEFGDIPPAQ